MVNLKNVYFNYSDDPTIKDMSFNIEKGEFVAVIGSNGAGKSTLCKLLNGILKPSAGSVVIDGVNTKETKTSTLAKHIGFLFQDPDRQICKNTIEQEILFGLRLAFNDENLIKDRLEKVIEMFKFDKHKDSFQLSRGERQRLALASVIAVNPKILILDEPTTGLDYKECMQIMEVIKRLNHDGVTVIMISHDMELVLDYAKRVIVLSDGRIVAQGDTKKIFTKPQVLLKASVFPPQIIQLALSLESGFEDVFDIEKMITVIKSKANCKGESVNERVS